MSSVNLNNNNANYVLNNNNQDFDNDMEIVPYVEKQVGKLEPEQKQLVQKIFDKAKTGTSGIISAATGYVAWANIVTWAPSYICSKVATYLNVTYGIPLLVAKVLAPAIVAPATLAAAKVAAPLVGIAVGGAVFYTVKNGPTAAKLIALKVHNFVTKKIWQKKCKMALLEDQRKIFSEEVENGFQLLTAGEENLLENNLENPYFEPIIKGPRVVILEDEEDLPDNNKLEEPRNKNIDEEDDIFKCSWEFANLEALQEPRIKVLDEAGPSWEGANLTPRKVAIDID